MTDFGLVSERCIAGRMRNVDEDYYEFRRKNLCQYLRRHSASHSQKYVSGHPGRCLNCEMYVFESARLPTRGCGRSLASIGHEAR